MLKRLIERFQATPAKQASNVVPAREGAAFEGKTALVTGGGGVIGGAIVREFVQQGAQVIALDKNAERLSRLRERLDCERVVPLEMDLVNAQLVKNTDFPEIDVLVHAAGVQFETDSLHDSDEQWEASLASNVAAPARLTRKLVPGLVVRQGNIVLVTSLHAELPSRWANYSAAKAAQAAMMREWAVDLAPRNVRVNAIAPGWVSAEQRRSKLALLGQSTIPPEYIARMVTVLASDHYSRFITGSTVTVDAGASLYSGRVPFDLPSDGA